MDNVSLPTIATHLGNQQLTILQLQEQLDALRRELEEARAKYQQLLDDFQKLHDDRDQLKMQITRRALDEVVAAARHRPEPSDEPAGDGQVVVAHRPG